MYTQSNPRACLLSNICLSPFDILLLSKTNIDTCLSSQQTGMIENTLMTPMMLNQRYHIISSLLYMNNGVIFQDFYIHECVLVMQGYDSIPKEIPDPKAKKVIRPFILLHFLLAST